MISIKQFFLEMKFSNGVLALLCVSAGLLLSGTARADGAVYAMTNALGNNQILVYHRASDGSLSSTPIQTIATGGGGSGLQLAGVDSLGSAGSVQLDPAHHLLFAVNTESSTANNGAGSYNTDCQQGTITSFLVASDGTLTFVDRVFSRGLFPNSLTVKRRGDGDDKDEFPELVYVLNAGGPEVAICNAQPPIAGIPNITGFKVNKAGYMKPIGTQQPIDPGPASGTGVNCVDATGYAALTGAPAADFECGLNPPSFPRSPAQIRFTPDGNQLVVTVKGTNTIYVFPVDKNGSADAPTLTQAPGPALPTFFGFTFDKHENLLVTEFFGTATSIPAGGKGAVSSFAINLTGGLSSISSHVADGGTAACWIALEPTAGKFAYVSNNLSASISSYAVGTNGSVTLLAATAASATGPNDLATATEGVASFLYVVEAGTGTVGAFQVNLTNGSLIPLAAVSGLPTIAAQGLAAF
jgi:6-phosphogluconolactonase (cycloisomerase 2 family)